MTHIEAESVSKVDKQRLYEIIRNSTFASQMANMKQFTGSADFSCNKYVFGATGSKIIFDGWKKYDENILANKDCIFFRTIL